jgi:hypothetical protein
MNNTIPAIIFNNIEKNFGSLKVLKGAYEVLTNPQSDRLRIFLSRLQVIRN